MSDQQLALQSHQQSEIDNVCSAKCRDKWTLAVFIVQFITIVSLMIYTFCTWSYNRGYRDAAELEAIFFHVLGVSSTTAFSISIVSLVSLILAPRYYIWTTLVTLFVSSVSLSIYCFTSEDTVVIGASCISFAIVFFFVNIALLRSHITFMSTTFITCVSCILSQYPSLIIFSIILLILLLAFVAAFCSFFLFQFYSHDLYLFWFLVPCFVWTYETCKYFLHTVVSSVFVSHFFVKKTDNNQSVTWNSFKRTILYSLGSIYIGSTLMTIFSIFGQIRRLFCKHESNDSKNRFGNLFKYFHSSILTEIAIYGKSYSNAFRDTNGLIFSDKNGISYERLLSTNMTLDHVFIVLDMFSGALFILFSYLLLSISNYKTTELDHIVSMFSGFWIGWISISTVIEVCRAGIFAIITCHAEDPKAVQDVFPELGNEISKLFNREQYL